MTREHSPPGPLMIIQYKNPPSNDKLIEMAKQALANMGYNTPEKRKEWHDSFKPIVILCTKMKDDEIELL